jgi:hypothetical protein
VNQSKVTNIRPKPKELLSCWSFNILQNPYEYNLKNVVIIPRPSVRASRLGLSNVWRPRNIIVWLIVVRIEQNKKKSLTVSFNKRIRKSFRQPFYLSRNETKHEILCILYWNILNEMKNIVSLTILLFARNKK